jgi:rhamnosyltransferase
MTSSKPQKVNTCAVIVTYHPDADLRERIAHIWPQVGKLVVVDNGSESAELSYLQQLSLEIGFQLISNAQNLGVATALNQGLRRAMEEGYAWGLTLDHDTLVADDMIETLSAVYEEFPQKDRLAIIGSNYIELNTGKLLFESNGDDGCSWREVKAATTSGSLMCLPVFAALGSLRDEFFIDCVDVEYCFRARSRGFKIVLTRKPIMHHAVGVTTMHKLLWITIHTSNHSPSRQYYMTRNYLALSREYLLREPVWTLELLCSKLKSAVVMCLFEKERLHKLRRMISGAFDGLFSNFGRDAD